MTTLAELVDELMAVRAERREVVKPLDDRIEQLESQIDMKMRLLSIEVVEGDAGIARREAIQRVSVQDWSKLQDYIHRNRAYDLLQRRVTESAILARMSRGESIDGCVVEDTYKLKIAGVK